MLKLLGISLIIWLLFWVVFFSFSPEDWEKRKVRFQRASENGSILISAIEGYVGDHGSPPLNLKVLVPNYINEIPSTSLHDYPMFEYVVHSDLQDVPLWELRINCPPHSWQPDVFFYWPNQEYPENIYGGFTEPIGNWCYVHAID